MTLVFATHNSDKVKEVQAILPDFIKILTLTDIGCLKTYLKLQIRLKAMLY